MSTLCNNRLMSLIMTVSAMGSLIEIPVMFVLQAMKYHFKES